MGQDWYRGKSTALAPSKPGGNIFDFGDGVYFTDSLEVAETYARARVMSGGGQQEIAKVTIERSELGRVLDLNTDSRWAQYLRKPLVGGRTPENLIRMANENYYRFFQTFLEQHKIDIDAYDAVIGPEFVHGGGQLCVRHRNGQPSPLAVKLQARLQPLNRPADADVKPTSIVPGQGLIKQSKIQGIVGNAAAMALLGQLIADAIEYLGNVAVRMRVKQEVITKHAKGIEGILRRGHGVMIVIATYKTKPQMHDLNEKRVTDSQFLAISIEGGPTFARAFESWNRFPRLIATPPADMNRVEDFIWIDPSK